MKDHSVFNWLSESSNLPGECFPGQSLVEIMGDSRVLIEDHHGVKEYSRQRIRINVKFGQLIVCGSELELTCMTKNQLVIHGKIDGIALQRRYK